MQFYRLAGATLLLGLAIGGCASLGFNAVPFPTYVAKHDYASTEFLRNSPKVAAYLGVPSQKSYDADGLVFALSITGGGARAAGYTLGVLSELQNVIVESPDGSGTKSALELVDFASSNSGGSWGLASYLADRTNCAPQPERPCVPYVLEERRPIISQRLHDVTKVDIAAFRFEKFSHDLLLDVTFGDVRAAGLPDAYINAALAPVQSPFVFESNMFKHYGVKDFVFAKHLFDGAVQHVAPVDPISHLPLGVAAFASGAVPGWFHVSATSSLCDTTAKLANASACIGQVGRAHLQIVDGGIYDNYGYRTAFEVFDTLPAATKPRKVLIQIDNTTNLPPRTVANDDGPNLRNMLMSLSFLHQDEVFRRTFKGTAKLHGIKPVVLDLFSAASAEGVDPLAFKDLRNLHCKSYGLTKKKFDQCMSKPEEIGLKPKEFGIAAYDVGMLNKTSFLFDYDPHRTDPRRDLGQGTLMWQLGRLSVRMQVAEICQALFGEQVRLDQCYLRKHPDA